MYKIELPASVAQRLETQARIADLSPEKLVQAAVIAAGRLFTDYGLAYAQIGEEQPPSEKDLLAFAMAIRETREWLQLAQKYLEQLCLSGDKVTAPKAAEALKTLPKAHEAVETVRSYLAEIIVQVESEEVSHAHTD